MLTWEKTGRTVGPEGSTVTYTAKERPRITIESRKRHIPHADAIRAMTDEELAKWLCDMAVCQLCPIDNCPGTRDCETRWLDWLKQEVSE